MREEVRGKSLEFRGKREEVRAKREGVSSLFPPRSSHLAPRSLLLAFFLSLFALPSSLLALDGLPFNGSNWIATGYCPTASDLFECEVTVDAAQPGASAAVFGTVRELEPERTFAFYVRQDGVDSSVVAYGGAARGGFFPRGKRVTLSVGPDGATWTWNGGSDRLSLTPGFARDGVTPLMIGDVNAASLVGDSVPAGTGAVMTLHRFRILRGGLELVHDYEPCLDAIGRYGVYDAVRREFLPCGREIGFAVNGKDAGFLWQGANWTYSYRVLSLTNAMQYVLSGVAANDEVQVRAEASGATVILSNAAVFASGRAAVVMWQGTRLEFASEQVLKTGDAPETLRYVQGGNYKSEPCVLVAPGVPVTPGTPAGTYATAEAATIALAGAYIVPSDPVGKVLVSGTLLDAYRDMFDIVLAGGGTSWSLEAVMTPKVRETANGATRQIDVAAIARLKSGVTTNVTAQGCAPGFFYSLYDGSALTNIVADANATNLNVLCGADAKVVFPEVKKPSDAAGFFSVGVKETPGITPPDGSLAPITIKPGATVEVK